MGCLKIVIFSPLGNIELGRFVIGCFVKGKSSYINNIRIKTEPVKAGADAKVHIYVWPLSTFTVSGLETRHICCCICSNPTRGRLGFYI